MAVYSLLYHLRHCDLPLGSGPGLSGDVLCRHELLSSKATLFGSSGRGAVASEMDGSKNCPIYQEAGCDVDYEWQVPVVEWWLKKYWDSEREDD